MESQYRYLGTNSDRDDCSFCGKQGLQKVVWLEHNESKEVLHVGVDCAKKLLKFKNLSEVHFWIRGETTTQTNQAWGEATKLPEYAEFSVAAKDDKNRVSVIGLAKRLEVLREISTRYFAKLEPILKKYPAAEKHRLHP